MVKFCFFPFRFSVSESVIQLGAINFEWIDLFVMDSYERFNKASFGWNRKMLITVGFDVYDKNFSPNLRTFFSCMLGVAFSLIIIYSFVISDSTIRLHIIFFMSLTSQVSVFTAQKSLHRTDFFSVFSFFSITGWFQSIQRNL